MLRMTKTIFIFSTITQLVLNSSETYAADLKKQMERPKEEESRLIFAGAEAIGAPLGDGKAYVIKAGLTAGTKISDSSSFSANVVWTNYLAENSNQDLKTPEKPFTRWNDSLKGYKFSVHYEYFPSIFGNKFYALIGPAFQSESYRSKDIELPQGLTSTATKYPSFGYDATTVGIDSGFGVRHFNEKFYVGIGIFEHYRPLKRLSYKNVNDRPTTLAGERLQSPDSVRYKILSFQIGMNL